MLTKTNLTKSPLQKTAEGLKHIVKNKTILQYPTKQGMTKYHHLMH